MSKSPEREMELPSMSREQPTSVVHRPIGAAAAAFPSETSVQAFGSSTAFKIVVGAVIEKTLPRSSGSIEGTFGQTCLRARQPRQPTLVALHREPRKEVWLLGRFFD